MNLVFTLIFSLSRLDQTLKKKLNETITFDYKKIKNVYLLYHKRLETIIFDFGFNLLI